MYSMDIQKMSDKDIYKILIGTIIPRPVTMIASLNVDRSINLAPFSYFNMVSYSPPVLMVSVQRQKNQMKDTTVNILREKEAVFHVVDQDNVEMVNVTATSLARGSSELALTDFQTVSSIVINTPGIIPAKARFETILQHHYSIPKVEEDGFAADVLFMRVVSIHLDEKVYRDSYIQYDQLQPISRLAGNDYSALGKLIQIDRPR